MSLPKSNQTKFLLQKIRLRYAEIYLHQYKPVLLFDPTKSFNETTLFQKISELVKISDKRKLEQEHRKIERDLSSEKPDNFSTNWQSHLDFYLMAKELILKEVVKFRNLEFSEYKEHVELIYPQKINYIKVELNKTQNEIKKLNAKSEPLVEERIKTYLKNLLNNIRMSTHIYILSIMRKIMGLEKKYDLSEYYYDLDDDATKKLLNDMKSDYSAYTIKKELEKQMETQQQLSKNKNVNKQKNYFKISYDEDEDKFVISNEQEIPKNITSNNPNYLEMYKKKTEQEKIIFSNNPNDRKTYVINKSEDLREYQDIQRSIVENIQTVSPGEKLEMLNAKKKFTDLKINILKHKIDVVQNLKSRKQFFPPDKEVMEDLEMKSNKLYGECLRINSIIYSQMFDLLKEYGDL